MGPYVSTRFVQIAKPYLYKRYECNSLESSSIWEAHQVYILNLSTVTPVLSDVVLLYKIHLNIPDHVQNRHSFTLDALWPQAIYEDAQASAKCY